MYDQTIQPMSRSLGALSNILRKAEDHCTAKGIKPVALLEFRLFPDMLSLIRQVQLSCDFAVRGAARLSGGELPSYPDTETSFEGLQARIAAVQAALAVYDYATPIVCRSSISTSPLPIVSCVITGWKLARRTIWASEPSRQTAFHRRSGGAQSQCTGDRVATLDVGWGSEPREPQATQRKDI